MANFLVNSASSETVGTNSKDLFDLTVLQGVSVFGVEGADTITADPTIGAVSATRINGGKGADTITLSSTSLDESVIFAGMGKDVLDIQADLTASTVRGGAGLDTIGFSSVAASATVINGNDMADTISAQLVSGSNETLLAAGMGSDTVSAIYSGGSQHTLNGGLGHDSISVSADGNLSSFVLAGGGGKDSIQFSESAAGALAGNFNLNGGDQSDIMRFSAAIISTTTATIAGGRGADTLVFSAAVTMGKGSVNAGEGKDSIYLGGAFGTAFAATDGSTLNGGAGADTIDVKTFAASGSNGGTIFGGDQADKFELGSRAVTVASGTTEVITGGSYLGYGAFDQSNLASTDLVSAGVTITDGSGGVTNTATLFNLRTDTVDLSVGTAVTTQLSTTGGLGFVTFTSTFNQTLTARVEALDAVAASGNSFAFRDSTGNKDYIFVQGGAIGSGTAGDLLVEVETAVYQIVANNASAISIRQAV